MGRYKLPELAYGYSAFEPDLSARLLELHHREHHAMLVRSANITLERLEDARAKGNYCAIAGLQRALSYYGSGANLHALWWETLTPNPAPPSAALVASIERHFGNMAALQRHLLEAATTLMGSGWAALMWDCVAKRLLVNQVFDNQSNIVAGAVPLAVIDAWEHAYHLQYHFRRADYFAIALEYWDWAGIERRLDSVRAADLGLRQAGEGDQQ